MQPAEVLEKMADVLGPSGEHWVKYTAVVFRDHMLKMCLFTACERVTEVRRQGPLADRMINGETQAERFMGEAAQELFPDRFAKCQYHVPPNYHAIPNFIEINDHVETTWEDIALIIKHAQEKARASG